MSSPLSEFLPRRRAQRFIAPRGLGYAPQPEPRHESYKARLDHHAAKMRTRNAKNICMRELALARNRTPDGRRFAA